MQGTTDAILGKFVTTAADIAVSIILVGSYAIGNAHENSDIDLIVLTKNQKDAELILTIQKELNKSESRPVIDCKVYTELEFSSVKSGPENRFLWTCLSNGKVLFGEDITETVCLISQQVCESYWKHIQNMEDVCRNLDANVKYTGSCYFIYDALSTTYFVDRFILYPTEVHTNKEEFIKSFLGREFLRTRERYYWIANQIETENSRKRLRIPKAVDRRFNSSDYKEMYEKAINIIEVLQDRYKELKTRFE
ncbi:MAG: nucleotidyltransferase domain-containing protein [Candidatus Thorarchaeota archaeon]|jgi:predicted nucleotidyltransferase